MHTIKITSDFIDLPLVERLAKEAFPPEEYLSPAKLIEMTEHGEVDFWGLYDGDTFVGFTVISIFEGMSYLFFLAIDASLRSKGYGGKVLRLLDELYPNKQQVVDFEKIDESAPNNAQRITRKAFYMRNGYQETGKFISYLGVDYEILCKDATFDFETFKKMMLGFKIDGFNPKYSERQ